MELLQTHTITDFITMELIAKSDYCYIVITTHPNGTIHGKEFPTELSAKTYFQDSLTAYQKINREMACE